MTDVSKNSGTKDEGKPTGPVADGHGLSAWFDQRPKWLQDAARRILQNGKVTADDLMELVVLCKKEVGMVLTGQSDLVPELVLDEAFAKADPAASLRLEAIGDIRGVNALAPRKALVFGSDPLTVVYGSNGSGKSGYMRILKHVCGARSAGALHGNIFDAEPQPKSCTISYVLDGTAKKIGWTPSIGVHSELRTIAIYDTDCAHVYVNDENEVAYEPPMLNLFRLLVDVCEDVDRLIADEITTKVSSKPLLPAEYSATDSGTWFKTLHRLTPVDEIDSRCLWTDELEADLKLFSQRLVEVKPGDRAMALRKTKARLVDVSDLLKALEAQLTDQSFAALLKAKSESKAKREAADVDAKRVFENAPVAGVASESWRLLWEQARAYSEGEAYDGAAFPNVADQARCVLCQQLLDAEAKDRLRAFEAFVKGNLEREAAEAEERVEVLLKEIGEALSAEEVDTRLDLAGVTEESTRDVVRSHCDLLRNRRQGFLAPAEVTQLQQMPDATALSSMAEMATRYEEEANAFDDDARTGQKSQIQQRVNELGAQKWLSAQKATIVAEVSRLNEVYRLEEARKLTNTKALSDKKSALADVLVTAAFKDRFKNELQTLGASRVKVTIEKTKTIKGQVWHQIKLVDSKMHVRTGEVLSEGEFRIVSIAAFLADIEAELASTPCVFDDPISSLDQDYEELTAARLVELCKVRQVIVFTHRLSLLAMLEVAAEEAGVAAHVLSLQQEPWGAGEPNEPPLPAQPPRKALNTLIGERLPKARKVREEQGTAAYSVEAKALCSDVRITIERLIEYDLLADVVQRFRRPIKTKGKIDRVAKIEPADCTFLDKMMTKYSRYEHSQPKDAPIPLPPPDELAEDLQKLKVWQEEFTSRPVPKP